MRRMIDPMISTWPEEDFRLVGGACGECGAAVFPIQDLCPRCSLPAVERITLPNAGTLVAWTTQGFLPGPPYLGDETPKNFVPFGVGLVQLGEVIRVESRLTENDPEKLAFGMDLTLTTVRLGTDAESNEVFTFAFRPVAGTGASQ